MIGNEKGQPIGGFTQIFASAAAQFASAGVATVSGTGESIFAATASAAGTSATDYRFEIVASAAGTSTGNMFGAGIIIPQGAGSSEGVATVTGVSSVLTVTETINFLQKPVDFVLAKEASMIGGNASAFTRESLKGIFNE